MIPLTYQTPAAILLAVGGLVSCLAGYRFFRTVLVVYGLVLGAIAAITFVGNTGATQQIVAAVVGGALGALILYGAYFVAVALVGAILGAFVVDGIWAELGRDPEMLIVVLFAVGGAVAAMLLQRYVIIVVTAYGGAWLTLVGAFAMLGNEQPLEAARRGNVWLVYPFSARQEDQWILLVWFVAGLAGTLIQLSFGGKKKAPRKSGAG